MPTDNILTDNVGFISPIGLGFTLVMCVLLLAVPRRHAFVPIILLTCYMTMGERLIIAGLDFTMLRVLLLAGWTRVISRGEMQIGTLNTIDKIIIAFTISSVITNTLLWGTFGAFINRLGLVYNILGAYFLFRSLLRNQDDCVRVLKVTAILIIPLAALMLVEKSTGRNLFAVFGGVPLITEVRLGRVRCQGPFAHPILAGTFGATLFPLFVGLWWQEGRTKVLALAGLAAAAVIVVASASSGPLVALLTAILGLALWPVRQHMRVLRWGLVFGLIGISAVMKAPIWFLIARIDVGVAGSTAYYRAYFIDRAIANFWDWWLIGTRSTRAWADATLGLQDRTNQYISIGADGGLVTMVLFILIIAYSFRAVGLTLKADSSSNASRVRQFFVWAFGAALFSHAVNYVSIGYFDQNFINYYLLIAMISTVWQSAAVVGESEQKRVSVAAAWTHRGGKTAALGWPRGGHVTPGEARLRPAPKRSNAT